jgi:hypothetical protein
MKYVVSCPYPYQILGLQVAERELDLLRAFTRLAHHAS